MPESCISNNFPVGNTSNKWLVTFAHIQMAKSNFPVFWLHVKNRACMEILKDGIYKSLDKDQYFHLTYLWWCFPLKWKFCKYHAEQTVMFSKLQRIILSPIQSNVRFVLQNACFVNDLMWRNLKINLCAWDWMGT